MLEVEVNTMKHSILPFNSFIFAIAYIPKFTMGELVSFCRKAILIANYCTCLGLKLLIISKG